MRVQFAHESVALRPFRAGTSVAASEEDASLSPVRGGACSDALCWCRPYGTPKHPITCQLLQRRRAYGAQAADSFRPRAPEPNTTSLSLSRNHFGQELPHLTISRLSRPIPSLPRSLSSLSSLSFLSPDGRRLHFSRQVPRHLMQIEAQDRAVT